MTADVADPAGSRVIHLNAFDMTCVARQSPGLWRHPDDQSRRYKDLEYWTYLARLLERGRFDALFIADVVGVYDVYRGSARDSIAGADQIPVNDPLMSVSAMAAVTEPLGFALTVSSTYEKPYAFARKMATLDHLTKGRIGWNIVTSYLESAARNLGLDHQVPHDERYAVADEFLEVCYKLWEYSWDDDSVVHDKANGVYADPDKIRPIEHKGTYFEVPGYFLCEPSPQRTPLLFQAGACGPRTVADEMERWADPARTCCRATTPGRDTPMISTDDEVFTELSAGDSSLGQIPQNHFFFVSVLAHAAAPAQQKFFYNEVVNGKRFGNALAERGTRTAKDYTTTITREADGTYLLNGTKYYCTGSVFAHWIPVYANDTDGRTHAVWVPAGQSGVAVTDNWNGMGQRTTGSGTVRFSSVIVPNAHVVPLYTIFEKTEIFGAFGQYMHAAVDTGIAVAALRDGKRLIREVARPWWEAEVDAAAHEPSVVEKFGELALTVRGARALLRAAGEALDEAAADLSEDTSAEASVAVAAARAAADTAALSVSSEIFALIGSRAADRSLNLDRHWRNARTHTLHDPRRWKIRHIGDWELADIAPPRNGIV